jgi:hypothetical protein
MYICSSCEVSANSVVAKECADIECPLKKKLAIAEEQADQVSSPAFPNTSIITVDNNVCNLKDETIYDTNSNLTTSDVVLSAKHMGIPVDPKENVFQTMEGIRDRCREALTSISERARSARVGPGMVSTELLLFLVSPFSYDPSKINKSLAQRDERMPNLPSDSGSTDLIATIYALIKDPIIKKYIDSIGFENFKRDLMTKALCYQNLKNRINMAEGQNLGLNEYIPQLDRHLFIYFLNDGKTARTCGIMIEYGLDDNGNTYVRRIPNPIGDNSLF